jgi:ABC-type glycerol-3-phosphate transport system substrate-binding protein
LLKENIVHYYRKVLEKSRSFIARNVGKKRFDFFLLIVVLVVFAVAISSHSRIPALVFKHTDITISQSGERLLGKDVIDAFIKEFENQNPEMRVHVVSETQPDIIFFDESEISGLLADSALALLEPSTHSTFHTEQWAMPLVRFTDFFLYNVDILQAANQDRPPRTRAEVLAAARAVAEETAAFPFALGLSQADPLALRQELYPWVWAAGEDLRPASAEGAELSSEMMEAIAFFVQLNNEGLLSPGSFEATRAQRLQEFSKGTIAMMSISSRDLAFLQSNAADVNFGITAVPQITQRQVRLGLSGIYAGISSTSLVPEEAQIFLTFLAERKHALEEMTGAVSHNMLNNLATQDPLYAKVLSIFESAEIVEYSPADPLEIETSRVVRQRLEEVLQ